MSINLYYNQVLILRSFHPTYLLQTGSAAARELTQLTVDDRVRAPLPFEARATDRSVDGVRGLLLGVEVGEPDWPARRAHFGAHFAGRRTCIQTDVFTRCLRNTTVRRGPLGSLKHETLRLEPRRAADRGVCRRGGGGQHRDERAPGGPAAPHLRVRADRRRDPVLPAPESICLLGQHAQVPGGHGERALRRHRPPPQLPQIRARRPRRRRHAQTASVDR